MQGSLQIRNVPDEARRALKARAAESGKSLNAFLLDLIAHVSRPTVNEVLSRAASRSERAAGLALDALPDARAERAWELGSQ